MDQNQPESSPLGLQNVSPMPVHSQTVVPKPGLGPKPAGGNPLAKHFRQPAIYIKLPSGGRYWEAGSLEMPESGEIAVYPMTTRDEITLRTPDALMNGQGVVEVLQSCVPAIKNAWRMPSIDTDAVLIALRIASYGHQMDFEGICRQCGEANTYGMDLRSLLSSIQCPDYESLCDLQAVNIKFKPQSYLQTTQVSQSTFEMRKYERLIEEMTEENVEEKSKQAAAQIKRLNELAIDMISNATEYIIDIESEQKIDRRDYIKEFYSNVDSKVIQHVNEWLTEMQKVAVPKFHQVNCADCGAEMELQIMFDYANFFVIGS